MRVHTNEASFQEITGAMMEKLREDGEMRNQFICQGIKYIVFQETEV